MLVMTMVATSSHKRSEIKKATKHSGYPSVKILHGFLHGVLQKVNKSFNFCQDLSPPTNQKLLLLGLISNCPGIKMGQKNWPKSAKKCQKEPKYVFFISTVRKLLDQSKNVTGRSYHK